MRKLMQNQTFQDFSADNVISGGFTDYVTDKQIKLHFEQIEQRWREKRELQKLKDLDQNNLKVNSNLRYNEKLNLNRKGHQAVFKSVTRAKRDTLPDGKANVIDRVPPPAYYKPRYGVVDPDQYQAQIRFKLIDQTKEMEERQAQQGKNQKK